MFPFYILFSEGVTCYVDGGNFLFKNHLVCFENEYGPEMGRSLGYGRDILFLVIQLIMYDIRLDTAQ
jgi:hypothetical protein